MFKILKTIKHKFCTYSYKKIIQFNIYRFEQLQKIYIILRTYALTNIMITQITNTIMIAYTTLNLYLTLFKFIHFTTQSLAGILGSSGG